MAQIKILVEGTHAKIEEGLTIGCSSILIKSDKNIVVDPGALFHEKELIASLKEEGLNPEEIKLVFLTHTHIDHTANLHLFKNAEVLLKFKGGNYPGQLQTIGKGLLKRTELFDGTKIADDVEILEVPGHSNDLLALVVNTKEGKIVIASDAFTDETWADLDKQPDPIVVADVDQFNKSRKKILEIANYIIPGHGKMFKVKK